MNFQFNNFQKLFILVIIFFGFFGVAPYQFATGQAKSSQAVYPVAGVKRLLLHRFLFIFCFIFIGLAFVSPAFGADHYVSPTGSDTWANSTNIATPCAATTAMTNAAAGDMVYFRGGTYQLGQSQTSRGVLQPAHSGTLGSPITFAAYPGEIPILNTHIQVKITGIADAGSDNTQLIDNDVDFIQAGAVSWDIVRTTEKEGGAPVAEGTGVVNIHAITLSVGTHNSINLVPGDAYEIGKDVSAALSNGFQSYIVFDGFVVQGDDGKEMSKIIIAGSDSSHYVTGNIVKNCIINGGSRKVVHGDNREGLRVDNTHGTWVINTKIYNFNNVKGNHNTSAVKMYHNTETLIENCEIYDSTIGIFDKSNSLNAIFRYNYIHNIGTGILFTGYAWVGPPAFESNHRNAEVYHNVIARMSSSGVSDEEQEWADSDNMEVYNNTFYTGNAKSASIGLSAGRKRFYNNIVYGLPTDNDIRLLHFGMSTEIAEIEECDYNQFGDIPNSFGVKRVKPDPNNAGNKLYLSYLPLSSWQSSGELVGGGNPDIHSLVSNPRFVNDSGQMNQLGDFRLAADSPCKGTGKDGADMGADISLVGIQGELTPDIIPPASPTGLTVQ